MEIRTLVTRSTPWAAAFLQVSSYSVRAESNWNMRIMFHPFSYQRWSIFDLNDKLSRRSLHSWIADCVKKKLAPTKKFCLQIQIICCSIIIREFEDSQFTQNNHNQSLTWWPEILDTSSGRSNSWKIWKFTYIPLKCIPLKCIPLKCMPLKCMYLKCVCLWNVCRWDPCLLIKAQNYHLFGSSRFITLLNLFPKYAMCQQWPGVEQERKECRKGFLSSASANNVKRAHFSNPLQNVLLQRSLNSSKFLCTAQKMWPQCVHRHSDTSHISTHLSKTCSPKTESPHNKFKYTLKI